MLIPADAVAQRRYVRVARENHPTPRLGIGPTILLGLRDLGYRDNIAALCALIDNAIDAQATEIDIVFDIEDGAVVTVAVIDNGIGMVPEMMRAACAVGATCPLGDGPHLARSGFGLPSAPFSIGRRFELLSRPAGASLAQVVFDLDDLISDDVLIPEAIRGELPPFVTDYLRRGKLGWSAGTVVLLRDLDRLTPAAPLALADQMHARLGHVFGRYLDRIAMRIEGRNVAAIDPLFLTAELPGTAKDAARAENMGTLWVAIGGGEIQVRTSLLPADFVPAASRRVPVRRAILDRSAVVRDTNGLIVSRLGRRLTVLPSTPLFNFSNADRPIKVEIDFPPELDDLFAPSLSLQQVQVSQAVWTAMRANGVVGHLESLRRRVSQRRGRQWKATASAPINSNPAAA